MFGVPSPVPIQEGICWTSPTSKINSGRVASLSYLAWIKALIAVVVVPVVVVLKTSTVKPWEDLWVINDDNPASKVGAVIIKYLIDFNDRSGWYPTKIFSKNSLNTSDFKVVDSTAELSFTSNDAEFVIVNLFSFGLYANGLIVIITPLTPPTTKFSEKLTSGFSIPTEL